MITLRFQSAYPENIRDAIHNLDTPARRLLGLPAAYQDIRPLFTFPVIRDRAIFAEVTVAPERLAVWLMWSEHAMLCGLISQVPDIIEAATQSEESEG